MEQPLQSPLSQQARPETFKPKVVEIYESLLKADTDPTEGLWRELFLLKPEQRSLQHILATFQPEDFLDEEVQLRTRGLFRKAIEIIEYGKAPCDENALDTLTIFLESVLSKRYANPSSDIIEVLAGLDAIDDVFAEFTAALDKTIRNGRTLDVRQKAVRAGLAAVAGSYQTGLVTYFLNRDLFASLMKLVQEADDHFRAFGPLALLGLLVNYNKFEFQNPYQLRLQDFVNKEIMGDIAVALGRVFNECRDEYTTIQNDQVSGWSLGGALSTISLGLTGGSRSTNDPSEEKVKADLAEQPLPEACITLSLYDFVNSNKLFCSVFASQRAENKQDVAPMAALISMCSYTLQNAHRSHRAALYVCHMLQIFQILVEDAAVAKELFSADSSATVRLARLRPPYLPMAQGERPLALSILDLSIDGINHNLRRRLDVDLYISLLGLQLRLITFCVHTRLRLVFHWSELWRSLLSFLRFLNQYAEQLRPLAGMNELNGLLTQLLGLALAQGESFLPDAKSYDDLFYKVFESGEALEKFRDLYSLSGGRHRAVITSLTDVSRHFKALMEEEKGKGNKNLSPREVTKLIKQGYDSLAIQAPEGLDRWEVYREADQRNTVKRVVRTAVQDIRKLLATRPF